MITNEDETSYKIRICQLREEFKNTEYHDLVSWDNLAAEATKELGFYVKSDNLRGFWKRYRKANKLMPDEVKKTKVVVETKADGSQSSSVEDFKVDDINQLKDEKYLLQLHGYDYEDGWRVNTSKSSQWQMPQKDGGARTLYSSSITVKQVNEENEFILEELVESVLAKHIEPRTYEKNVYAKDVRKKVLILEPVDLHFGKTEYITLAEQKQSILNAFNEILSKSQDVDIERIVLTIGNDFYNCDSVLPQSNVQRTQKGTILSSSGQFQEMYDEGVDLAVTIVNQLLLINNTCDVEVIYIPANHDRILGFTLATLLKALFSTNNRVNVDTNFKDVRKYRRYGKFAVGFCHGEKDKNKLTELFPIEAPMIFAEAKYREIHAAHYHSELSRDNLGILVRRIAAMSPEDTWLYENGYVGATRRMQGFIVDLERGIENFIYGYEK